MDRVTKKNLMTSFMLGSSTGLQTWQASGSAIAGLIVGVGASLLPWMFNNAAKEAPEKVRVYVAAPSPRSR